MAGIRSPSWARSIRYGLPVLCIQYEWTKLLCRQPLGVFMSIDI
jgi:hypothetical protein